MFYTQQSRFDVLKSEQFTFPEFYLKHIYNLELYQLRSGCSGLAAKPTQCNTHYLQTTEDCNRKVQLSAKFTFSTYSRPISMPRAKLLPPIVCLQHANWKATSAGGDVISGSMGQGEQQTKPKSSPHTDNTYTRTPKGSASPLPCVRIATPFSSPPHWARVIVRDSSVVRRRGQQYRVGQQHRLTGLNYSRYYKERNNGGRVACRILQTKAINWLSQTLTIL